MWKKSLVMIAMVCFVMVSFSACQNDNDTSLESTISSMGSPSKEQTGEIIEETSSKQESEGVETIINSVIGGSVESLSEEQIRKIVKEEISKIDIPKNNADKFIIGENVECTEGESFVWWIADRYGEIFELNINNFEMTKKKELKLSEAEKPKAFQKYVYNLKISGTTDRKIAGQQITISFQGGSLSQYHINCKVLEDGSFNADIEYSSNAKELYVTPWSTYIPIM